jgi:hypothetical protein
LRCNAGHDDAGRGGALRGGAPIEAFNRFAIRPVSRMPKVSIFIWIIAMVFDDDWYTIMVMMMLDDHRSPRRNNHRRRLRFDIYRRWCRWRWDADTSVPQTAADTTGARGI